MASGAAAAFDVFMDARGMVTFYMFIMEEASQCLGMAAYLAHKDEDPLGAQAYAQYNRDNIITQAKAFCGTIGITAYPMNEAFGAYFDAQDRAMQFYLDGA